MSTQTAPHLANSGTTATSSPTVRPYTAADHAVLPKVRRNDVARIREATDRHQADFRAAMALGTAAYWLAAGAPDEAHRLISEAAAAHRERFDDLIDQAAAAHREVTTP